MAVADQGGVLNSSTAAFDRATKILSEQLPNAPIFFRGEEKATLRQEPRAGILADGATIEADDYDTAALREELAFIRSRKEHDPGGHVDAIWATLDARSKEQPTAEDPDEPINFDPWGCHYLTGLALSGGGIRSAIFSLGVMQRLAGKGILQRFDYMSTVSGGGFIGSALSWWLSGKTGRDGNEPPFDTGENFPFGTADPADPENGRAPILQYLRQNGKYLTPGNGIGITSGVSVVLRTILLNLLVWIPIAAFMFVGLHWVGVEWIDGCLNFSGELADTYELILVAAGGILVAYAVTSLNHSFVSWMDHRTEYRPPDSDAVNAGELPRQHHRMRSLTRKIVRWLIFSLLWVTVAVITIVLLNPEVLGHIFNLLRDHSIGQSMPMTDDPSGKLAGACLELLSKICGHAIAANWWQGGLFEVMRQMFDGSPMSVKVAGRLGRWWLGAVFFAVLFTAWFIWRGRKVGWVKRDWVSVMLIFAAVAGLSILDGWLAGRFDGGGHENVSGSIRNNWTAGLVQITIVIIAIVMINFLAAVCTRKILFIDRISLRYSGRRGYEEIFGGLLKIAAALIVVGTIPLVWSTLDSAFDSAIKEASGPIGVVMGIASALWGLVMSRGKGGGIGTRLILIAGAFLLIYGMLLVGYRISVFVIDPPVEVSKALVQGGFFVLVLVAAISGWFTNLNLISLNRYYRDRLMEAFMPDWETVRSGESKPAGRADDIALPNLWEEGRIPAGPLHLINTNAVLVNSKTRKYRQRGGDNFVLSPFLCGSNATGWMTASEFDAGNMSVASAMATSGAAANPRTGAGGRGITRNLAVSMVMSLLNFRLGFWIRRPQDSWLMQSRPNHFFPSGTYALFPRGYTEQSNFLELSDGAHFENLGIYELVRRRCGLIVVCDGGQDVATSYSDFVVAIRRIEQDFGAKLVLEKGFGPEMLITAPRPGSYPKATEYANQGYFVATIEYGRRAESGPWPKRGLLIYLKTTMIDTLSMKAKGYSGAHKDFPDQSTGDQFFDEEQFEAYRELGFRIADQMTDDLNLDEAFAAAPRPDLNHWVADTLTSARTAAEQRAGRQRSGDRRDLATAAPAIVAEAPATD